MDTSSANASGNATVHLSFLRGWTWNYGDAVVSCASGCTCNETPFSCWSTFPTTLYILQPVQVRMF